MAGIQETIGELYARIGLDYDELQNQFVQVDRTLRDNIARLNRQSNIVRLQAQVEMSGLDEVADASRILQIRQRALQQQLDIQRQRMRLYENVLADARQRTGELSDETQRAQIDFERARLATARLERQLNSLNETHQQTATGLREFAETFKQQFENLASREIILGVADALQTAAGASVDLVERFKEVEKQAYELNLPFQQTRDLLRVIRLAGGDIGDFEGFVRGLSDALVKGEIDDPEFLALSRYNAELLDAEGRLKNFAELSQEILTAYRKAKAEGNEIEFLQLVGGEQGVRDAIQLFERWDEAEKDADRIFKARVDEAELHAAERTLGLLTEQIGEFRNEVVNLFTPSTIEAAETFFEILKDATQWIQENDDAIRRVGSNIFDAFFQKHKAFTEPFRRLWNQIHGTDEATKDLTGSVQNLGKELEKKPGDSSQLSQYGMQRISAFRDELEDLRLELDFADEFERQIAEIELWRKRELTDKIFVSPEERTAVEELYSAKLERVEQARADKRREIEEASAERTKNIAKETAEMQYRATHTAYENEVHDIWNWFYESLEAVNQFKEAMDDKTQFVLESAEITKKAMAQEAEAFEREIERIKGANQSLFEKIFEQEHSRLEIDVMRAQKERAHYYDEGIYAPADIEHWYKNRLAEIGKSAFKDESGYYTDAPDLSRRYLREIPNINYFERIQAQTDEAIARSGHPAQKIQDRFERSVEKLGEHLDNLNRQQSAEYNHGIEYIYKRGGEIVDSGYLYQPAQASPFGDDKFVERQATAVAELSSNIADFDGQLVEVLNGLSEFSRHAGEVAQEPSRAPRPIVVNLSPTIDLGGAYVFDNAMKSRLTDDITKEVANAVTSAVSNAVNQHQYGFGN